MTQTPYPSDLDEIFDLLNGRHMAVIATSDTENGDHETLGVVRAIAEDDFSSAVAIVVRSDLKEQGLGRKLREKIIDYCRSRGVRQVVLDL